MCKVYNSIGSLTAIQHHLHQCHIKEFSTLYQVTDFQKNYFIYRRQIISNQERLTAQEKDLLSFEIPQLDDSIKKKRTDIEKALRSELERLYQQLHHLPVATENTIRGFTIRLKKTFLKMRIGYKERNFNSKIERLVRHPSNILAKKIDRYQYIVTHFADAVNEGCLSQLKALERKK